LGQIYQNEMACGLRQLGYEVERKPHGQFELRGYSDELLKTFSTRRQQIVDLVKTWEVERTQIVDVNGILITSGAARREAANLRSRKSKPKEMPREKLRRGWDALVQLKGLELPPLPARERKENSPPAQEVSTVVNAGVQHCAEREAVFKRTKIERFIFEHHLGAQSFRELSEGIDHQAQLIRVTGGKYTTETALHLELETIRLMQEGKGQVAPILAPEQVSGYLEN
jgi:TrwC relaxase